MAASATSRSGKRRQDSYATALLVLVGVLLAGGAAHEVAKPLFVAGRALWSLLGEGPSLVVREESWRALRSIKRLRWATLDATAAGRQLLSRRPPAVEAEQRRLLSERLDELRTAIQEYESLPNRAPAPWMKARDRWQQFQGLLELVASTHPQERVDAETAAGWSDELVAQQIALLRLCEELSDLQFQQIASRQRQLRLGDKETLLWALTVCLAVGLVVAVLPMIHAWRLRIHVRVQYQRILKTKEALQKLSAKLMDAQEQERRSISRELHDDIGQTLIAARLDLAMLERKIPPELSHLQEFARDGKLLVDETLQKVRDLTQLLRPTLLDEQGLIPAARWLLKGYGRRTGIRVSLEANGVEEPLPKAVEIAAYRLIQECLTNTVKHAEATSVQVSIRIADGALLLSIQDNGRGTPAVAVAPGQAGGLGLLGIRERVEQLSGRVEIRSEPGLGFGVRAAIPLGEPARAVPFAEVAAPRIITHGTRTF